jgi:hypothetical protein
LRALAPYDQAAEKIGLLLIQGAEIVDLIAELGKPANDEPEQFCLPSLHGVVFFPRRRLDWI